MILQMFKSAAAAILLACFCVLQPCQVWAATTAVTIAPISGVINFGSFTVLATCSSCTITISPGGGRTASAGILLSNSSPFSAATFTVTQTTCPSGNPKCTGYAVAAAATSALSVGGVNMTLGAFTFNPTVAPTGSAPLSNTLSVGATLTIPTRPTAGTSSGGGFTLTTTP